MTEEIARVALFLASEQASYVTGAIVSMDGGASAVIQEDNDGVCAGDRLSAGEPPAL